MFHLLDPPLVPPLVPSPESRALNVPPLHGEHQPERPPLVHHVKVKSACKSVASVHTMQYVGDLGMKVHRDDIHILSVSDYIYIYMVGYY